MHEEEDKGEEMRGKKKRRKWLSKGCAKGRKKQRRDEVHWEKEKRNARGGKQQWKK